MEKHISKKFVKGLLALSAGFLLASCDPVHALPKNHAESIVVNEDKSSLNVSDNDLLQIYNLIESGKNEEVVSQILREIAEKKFGTYKDLYKAVSDPTYAERDKFIAAHKDYFGEDAHKVERFEDFVQDISQRISESFYNEISSSSYNDEDGKFSEEKLYNAKRYDLYDLKTETVGNKVVAPEAVRKNKFYVDKRITKDNAVTFLAGTYSSDEEGKRGYIEEKVYPEILKNKFVESYIYDNNPSSLGRAYARKINYIKVSYEEEHAPLWKMLKFFASEYIEKAKVTTEFELIASAVKGFTSFNSKVVASEALVNEIYGATDTTKDEYKVCKLISKAYDDAPETITVKPADAAHYKYIGTSEEVILVKPGTYYKDTKLGQILESYADAIEAEKDGRFATAAQKAELDKFTGEGKSKEYGLMQKLISLAKEDYTTDGWVLKNGGATELPSVIRDRLFNIKVANILDDNTSTETHTAALPEETTPGKYNEKNYLRNIKGNKLMLSSEASPYKDDHFNYIHQDKDGKAFYIVSVEEAPSTAKLNKNLSPYGEYKIEQISRQIAKVLGTKDSYIKDAYTEMLKNYEFKFFDTSLFEYINSEYPDLDLDEND